VAELPKNSLAYFMDAPANPQQIVPIIASYVDGGIIDTATNQSLLFAYETAVYPVNSQGRFNFV